MARSRLISKVSAVKKISWVRKGAGGGIRTLVHFDIDGTPPDVVLAGVFVHNTLVLWTATGLFPGKVDESTRGGDDGTLVPNGVFIEQGDGGVAFEMDFVHVKAGLRKVLEIAADHWWDG
jgi:hypothetical protein